MLVNMAQYKVLSDSVSGAEKGKIVTEADFPAGINFEALVEAGHLVAHRNEKPSAPKDEK